MKLKEAILICRKEFLQVYMFPGTLEYRPGVLRLRTRGSGSWGSDDSDHGVELQSA